MAEKIKTVLLRQITIDALLNPRAGGLDEDHVADLLDVVRAKKKLPALVLYRGKDGTHWLSEGFHRAEAYRRAGAKSVPCIVREGERTEALANACGSNISHGLKRTTADKR